MCAFVVAVIVLAIVLGMVMIGGLFMFLVLNGLLGAGILMISVLIGGTSLVEGSVYLVNEFECSWFFLL